MNKTLKWHHIKTDGFDTRVALTAGAALVIVHYGDVVTMTNIPFTQFFQEHDWVKWIKDHSNESA